MKVLLIPLALVGLAAAVLLQIERQAATFDFGPITGSVGSEHSSSSDLLASDGKTQRLLSQPPVASDAAWATPATAPLVMAQSSSIQSSSVQSSPVQAPSAQPSLSQPFPSDSAPPQVVPLTTLAQAPATPRPEVDGQSPVVDESALRYFAARGDTARLQAEISRLRALYPTWTPPADPLAVRASGDPQLVSMWQLYAQSRFDDVRQAIAQRQTTEPGWQPPADLLDRLKLAEARSSLTAASDRKEYETVIRTAAENPTLLTCAETDVLWRVAEAFADTDRQDRARDAYMYVLNNCDNSAERTATVQKASDLLTPDMLETLLAKERTPPGGQPEFEPLRDDLARRFVSQGNGDPKLVVPEKYLTRLEQLAEKQGLSSDALMLGWYYYRRDNLGGAERWFRRAYIKEETASAGQGLALTLIKQNSPGEAENVLYRWRDSSDGAKAAYMAAVANLLAQDPAPVLPDAVLARMAPMVITQRDAAAAQQFGWYARAMQQTATAVEWFSAALGWKPDDEPSAYGLALSRNDLGDRAGVANLQRTWAAKSERIAGLGRPDGYAADPRTPRQAREYAERLPQSRLPAQAAPRQPAAPMQMPAARPPSVPASSAPFPAAPPATVRAEARSAPPQRAARVVAAQNNPSRGCAVDDIRPATADQALARGWCLMDLNRPLEAVQAFDLAAASVSQVVRSDAAYGRSLAYLRVGLTDNASASAAAASQPNTRAVELQSAILSNRALNAFKLGRFREALIALDQRAQIVPEQADLMILRGYAYVNIGRRPDAQRIFQALASTGNADGQRALADLIYPPEN